MQNCTPNRKLLLLMAEERLQPSSPCSSLEKHLFVPANHGRHRKLALHPLSAGPSESGAPGVIGQKADLWSLPEPPHLWGHQPTGFPMFHHLGEAAHVGSHHRQTGRHGLQNHVGQAFLDRTQRQQAALL